MNKIGPVVIIEDDEDDKELMMEVFKKLNYDNQLVFFHNGKDALDYLVQTDVMPFLILSDINMPLLNGFELRKKLKLDADLQLRCIPYLYFTTARNQKVVIEAYSLSAQGFFVKPNTMGELERIIKLIMEYWTMCASPNNFSVED